MLRNLRGMHDVRLTLYQGPFETLLGTVNVETLSVLSCRIEEESPYMSRHVTILDLDMT